MLNTASVCLLLVVTSDGDWGLANSTFGQALITGPLQPPEDTLLPGGEHLGPQLHVFGADEAFLLHRDLMRSIPGVRFLPRTGIFDNRLSRVRKIVEKAFGFLSSVWCMH